MCVSNPIAEGICNANQIYLDGVKGGLLSYDAWLKRHDGQPAFCMPEQLAMTTDQAEDIMLRSASKRAAKGDMLIVRLLLSGLQDAFPCEKARDR